MGQGGHTAARAEQEVKEEEFKKVPAPQVQLTPVYMAYKLSDPTYSVPSGPSTADAVTAPPVVYFHFRLPAATLLLPTVTMAYMFLS